MGRSLKSFGMLNVTVNTFPGSRGCRLEAGDVAAELLQLLGAPHNQSS